MVIGHYCKLTLNPKLRRERERERELMQTSVPLTYKPLNNTIAPLSFYMFIGQ